MRKNIKNIIFIVIAVICVFILIMNIVIKNNNKKQKDDGIFRIVTSFYPIYIMTLNITQGAEDVELVNMADVNNGCIHNYTLVSSDMKKIENANVFIQNGLGLEGFIDKVTLSNKNIQIVDSSKNISNLIEEENNINPHIWTSISNYIIQVENIKNALVEKDSKNAKIYENNAKEYIQKLTQLKLEYSTQLQELRGKEAICLNESFEYLTKDLGINVTSIHTSHEESTLSAEKLKNVIDKMKQNNIKIIIVDIDDDLKNAQTIANETGAKIYKLDSALSGNFNKDSYINCMNGNLERLKDKE